MTCVDLLMNNKPKHLRCRCSACPYASIIWVRFIGFPADARSQALATPRRLKRDCILISTSWLEWITELRTLVQFHNIRFQHPALPKTKNPAMQGFSETLVTNNN